MTLAHPVGAVVCITFALGALILFAIAVWPERRARTGVPRRRAVSASDALIIPRWHYAVWCLLGTLGWLAIGAVVAWIL